MNSWYIDRSRNLTQDGVKESLAIVDAAGNDDKKLNTDALISAFSATGVSGNVISSPAALTRYRDHGLLKMDNSMGDSAKLFYEGKYDFGELITDLFIKRFTRKEEYTATRPFVILCMTFSHMIQMGIDEDDIFLTVHECHKYLLDIDNYNDISFELIEQIISERKYSYNRAGRAILPCIELSYNGSSFYRLYFNALKETPLFISDVSTVSVLKPNIKQKDFFRYVSENADEFEIVSISNNTELYKYYCNRNYGFAEIIPNVVKDSVTLDSCDIEYLFDYLFGYDRHSNFEFDKYLTKECFGVYFAFISVPGIAIAKIRDNNPDIAAKLLDYSHSKLLGYVADLENGDFAIQIEGGSSVMNTVETININEAAFKSWMRSQTKLSGEPYFTENTVSQYISALKAVSRKFSLAPVLNIQNVDEFDAIDTKIRSHVDFEKFNKSRGNGALSAGLVAYRRFLISPKTVESTENEPVFEDDNFTEITEGWFVGANYEETDHTDFFISQGIWQYGGDKLPIVDSIKPGDKIAIKAMFVQKKSLPFENFGKSISCLKIKAVGTVIENLNTENKLIVTWEKCVPEKIWYHHTGKLWGTVAKVSADDSEISANLLAFAFEGTPQPYNDIIIQPDVPELIPHESDEVSLDSAEETEGFTYEEIIMSPSQTIYYGAPGTGKSFEVDKTLTEKYPEEETRDYHSARVIFHPDYTYSDFVGSIRPVKPRGSLEYDFVAGPFTKLLEKSFVNYTEEFFLILEEINRGNAAAIFGDLFQLLDRDPKSGKSKYRINNVDVAGYLKKNKKLTSLFEQNNIWLPSNFNIICTMNTADQNVFVLDSAFKRRFSEEYVQINFEMLTEELKSATAVFVGTVDLQQLFANTNLASFVNSLFEKGELRRDWATFAKIVNHIIDEINDESGSEQISEDKKLGPFFVTPNDLKDRKSFINKVLHYLKQDVFKYVDSYFAESFESIYNKYKEDTADIFALLKGRGE